MRPVFIRIQLLKHLSNILRKKSVMKEIMSTKKLRPRFMISLLIFSMTINIFMNSVVANYEYAEVILNSSGMDRRQMDLPAKMDFNRYLSALEKVVDFCVRHKHYVDLNLQFGLFFVDVNLRHIMQQRPSNIPGVLRTHLEQIFVKNDALAGYFHLMVERNQNQPNLGQNIKLSRLLYNSTTWPTPPETFNMNLLNQSKFYSQNRLKEIYGNWQEYYNNVMHFERPSPAESDACIAFLARSLPEKRTFMRRTNPNCLTPLHCRQLVQEGSDFGYGLTHRLLFMIVARFSRRCIVFSEREDKLKTDLYCKKSFNEAQYIAGNNFVLPDLLFEQVTLCGLLGHAQFIRKHWLKSLLHFQTFEGCFSEKIATGGYDENLMRDDGNHEWKMERDSDIMNGQCNGHFTAVAAAALANALRYIIETYY